MFARRLGIACEASDKAHPGEGGLDGKIHVPYLETLTVLGKGNEGPVFVSGDHCGSDFLADGGTIRGYDCTTQ